MSQAVPFRLHPNSLLEELAAVPDDRGGPGEETSMSSDLIDDFLRTLRRKGRSANTLDAYRWALGDWIRFLQLLEVVAGRAHTLHAVDPELSSCRPPQNRRPAHARDLDCGPRRDRVWQVFRQAR